MTRSNFLVTAIVAIAVAAGTTARGETALHNFAGYTSSDAGLIEFSVLIFDDAGRIVATGDDTLLEAHPDAEAVDGGGKAVLPGLIDAHAHVAGLGFLKTSLDLTSVPSVDDAVARIAAYAKEKPRARWITGRGWNQVLWPVREFPNASQIDAVVADRPVWLRRIDGHAGWANSAAMRLAGIDADTPDPVGGKIVRDSNGHATGIFIDKAMGLIEAQVPQPDKAEGRAAIKAAVETLLSEGISSVHDAGISIENAEIYMSMADDGELGMRIYAMTGGAGDVLDAIGKPIYGYGNDHLDISSVKIYTNAESSAASDVYKRQLRAPVAWMRSPRAH